ncbi:sigma factor-like helix-turn-helix DNA-binding protein [Zhouia sp. PK063]|uniref:sigma factor-like helix-turn-helix DNA-binding protein n=1 Tax=Zhouia sp. PK063 TaxID=3373602 RepID=UPI0037B56774
MGKLILIIIVTITEEIAELLEFSKKEVAICLSNAGFDLSLDAPLQDGESSNLYDVLPATGSVLPDTKLLTNSLAIDIQHLFQVLSSREQEVLIAFYGLNGQRALRLEDIAVFLDISRERVRQIKEVAMKKLKTSEHSSILLKYLGGA